MSLQELPNLHPRYNEMIDEEINRLSLNHPIEIKGLDKVPYIAQGRVLFDFENTPVLPVLAETYGITADDLYQAKGKFNVAIDPSGNAIGLRVVSDKYKVIQHKEALYKLLTRVPDSFELSTIDITTDSTGGKCFFILTSGKRIEIKQNDEIVYQILCENSADASKRFSITGGAFRFACSNGLVIPDERIHQVNTGKKLHRNSLDLDYQVHAFMGNLADSIQAMNLWKDYTRVKVDSETLDGIFTKLNEGERSREALMHTKLRGEHTTVQELLNSQTLTVWEVYNSYTQKITDEENMYHGVKAEKTLKVGRLLDNLVKLEVANA